jgi:hypothetical protein
VKVHADGSNPAGGQVSQAMGRTKGGLNTKIHAVVNARSQALMVALSSGNEADVSLAKELTEYLPPGSIVIADKAYDSCPFREAAATNGIKTSISRSQQPHDGSAVLSKALPAPPPNREFIPKRLSATVELLPATTNSPKPCWVLSASPCCSP